MVGVFVAFIRVVYGRMIYMSLPFTKTSSGLKIRQHDRHANSHFLRFAVTRKKFQKLFCNKCCYQVQ